MGGLVNEWAYKLMGVLFHFSSAPPTPPPLPMENVTEIQYFHEYLLKAGASVLVVLL